MPIFVFSLIQDFPYKYRFVCQCRLTMNMANFRRVYQVSQACREECQDKKINGLKGVVGKVRPETRDRDLEPGILQDQGSGI